MPKFFNSFRGVVEIQEIGTGRGARQVLDKTSDIVGELGSWTKNLGEIVRRYRQSARTGEMVPVPPRRSRPEPSTIPLSMEMAMWNWLEHVGPDGTFAMYARQLGEDQYVGNDTDYSRIDIWSGCQLASGIEYPAMKTTDDQNNDAIQLSASVSVGNHSVVLPVSGAPVSMGLSSTDDCEIKCGAMDANGSMYLGTEADGVGTHPFVVTAVANPRGQFVYSEHEVTGLTADISALAVAGSSVFIASGTSILKAAKDDLDSFALMHTAAGAVAGLHAIDASTVIAMAASGELIWTEDGGGTWTDLTSGSAENLICAAFRSAVDGFIGGANGTMLRYDEGIISALTIDASLAAVTVNQIALAQGRDDEVYAHMANGEVWKSEDDGVTWFQATHLRDTAGLMMDGVFAEWEGPVCWMVHETAGGLGEVIRDFAGFPGGTNNQEMVTISGAANTGLNGILPVDANKAYAFGEDNSGNAYLVYIDADRT